MTEYEVLYDGSRNCLRCGAGMSSDSLRDELRKDCERLMATEAAVMAERDALKDRCERLVEQLGKVRAVLLDTGLDPATMWSLIGAIIEKENT